MEDRYYNQLRSNAIRREQQPRSNNQKYQEQMTDTTTIDAKEHKQVEEANSAMAQDRMVEDMTNERRVEDLNLRLLKKRRRREHTKLKAEVINYTKLKT